MADEKKKNTVLYIRGRNGKVELRCPGCGETLQSADVENFPRCPYCNLLLTMDARLEDFILEPIVRTWTSKNQHFQG